MITLNAQNNNHYYLFNVKSIEGKILYIGIDKINNIVTFKKILQNPMFDVTKDHEIEILGCYDNYIKAQSILSASLCGNMPVLNLREHHNRGVEIQHIETGIVYRNAAAACKALNIQPPRMSMHLKNKKGNNRINGMTFKYITRKPV